MKIDRKRYAVDGIRDQYGLSFFLKSNPEYKSAYTAILTKPSWVNSACHSQLNQSPNYPASYLIANAPMIECRYEDIVSRTIHSKDRAEFFAFTEFVFECFKPWFDMSYKEMVESYPKYLYVRLDGSKMPGGMILGILNCMRGIEERWDVSCALGIVREDFPELAPAQQLILAHILHPTEYKSRYYNENHSIWLPQKTIDLHKIKDFSFLQERQKQYIPYAENTVLRSGTGPSALSSWETMLPNECYNMESPFALVIGGDYSSPHYPLLIRSVVEYFLDSSLENFERIEKNATAPADCPW